MKLLAQMSIQDTPSLPGVAESISGNGGVSNKLSDSHGEIANTKLSILIKMIGFVAHLLVPTNTSVYSSYSCGQKYVRLGLARTF